MRQAMKIMITEKDPLRLTDDRKTFADYDVKMDAHIILRDIGPQVGYRNVCVISNANSYLQVFVLEYAGPLVIMLLLAMRPSFLYGHCDESISGPAMYVQ